MFSSPIISQKSSQLGSFTQILYIVNNIYYFIFYLNNFNNVFVFFCIMLKTFSDVYPNCDSSYRKTRKAVQVVSMLMHSFPALLGIRESKVFSFFVEFKGRLPDMHFTYIKYTVRVGQRVRAPGLVSYVLSAENFQCMIF